MATSPPGSFTGAWYYARAGALEIAADRLVSGIERKTFAATRPAARMDQPIRVVSERLGHTKMSMTMEVYAHLPPDMQRDAATPLGEILRKFALATLRDNATSW